MRKQLSSYYSRKLGETTSATRHCGAFLDVVGLRTIPVCPRSPPKLTRFERSCRRGSAPGELCQRHFVIFFLRGHKRELIMIHAGER